MSFALLDLGDDVIATKGNHAIAVVKGKDNFKTLQESFTDVFNEINKLHVNSENKIEVNDRVINLEFFLGGDYKFILLMMGLKGATSHYTCVWHKDNRWDTSFPLHHSESSNPKRTIKEISELAKKKGKQNYHCEYTPVVTIELDHVILDELHLLLKILDVLIENLIQDALEWDKKENKIREKASKKNTHSTNLQTTIQSCGISFDI